MLEDQRCWMSTKPVRICNPDVIRRHESMEKTIFCLYSLGTPHRLSMNRKWKYCCSGCLSLPGGGRQYDPAYASPGAYLYLPLSNWIDIEEIERYFKSKLSNRKWEWKYEMGHRKLLGRLPVVLLIPRHSFTNHSFIWYNRYNLNVLELGRPEQSFS